MREETICPGIQEQIQDSGLESIHHELTEAAQSIVAAYKSGRLNIEQLEEYALALQKENAELMKKIDSLRPGR